MMIYLFASLTRTRFARIVSRQDAKGKGAKEIITKINHHKNLQSLSYLRLCPLHLCVKQMSEANLVVRRKAKRGNTEPEIFYFE